MSEWKSKVPGSVVTGWSTAVGDCLAEHRERLDELSRGRDKPTHWTPLPPYFEDVKIELREQEIEQLQEALAKSEAEVVLQKKRVTGWWDECIMKERKLRVEKQRTQELEAEVAELRADAEALRELEKIARCGWKCNIAAATVWERRANAIQGDDGMSMSYGDLLEKRA